MEQEDAMKMVTMQMNGIDGFKKYPKNSTIQDMKNELKSMNARVDSSNTALLVYDIENNHNNL